MVAVSWSIYQATLHIYRWTLAAKSCLEGSGRVIFEACNPCPHYFLTTGYKMQTAMQAKTGSVMAGRQSSLGSMSMGGQRGMVLRQAFRGTPLVGNNRAIRIGGVRTHAINIRAEKVRASSHACGSMKLRKRSR